MGARYAYLCPPRWAGGWRVTIGVPLSESIQVRVGVLRLGGEAAVRVRTRRVRGLGALVEWVGPQRIPRRPVGWRRIPCRRGSQKLLRRPPGGGRCAPALRSGPPGRGPAERTQRHRPPWAAGPGVSRPGPVRARAPAAGQPGEQVGGRHPPASAPGEGPDPPGDRSRAAARRKQSGTRSGHAAPALVCEAIDTAARRRPTRRDDIPLRPGAQDAGRGQPGAPSNKTSSLRHNFQGCPRHAWQPMHSTFRRTGELFMECSE